MMRQRPSEPVPGGPQGPLQGPHRVEPVPGWQEPLPAPPRTARASGVGRDIGDRVRSIAIIDAPSVLGLFPRGVEQLPEALHRKGLADELAAADRRSVTPPPYSPERDPITGLKNAAAMVDFSVVLASTVIETVDRGHFPLVLGGDCSVVFGPLVALAQRGRSGLLFLDGHADFAHPADEPSGEAASMDLALATGRGPSTFGPIGGQQPLISDDRVAVLGYRVHGDGTDTCQGVHIADTSITAIDLDQLRRRGLQRSIQDALDVVARDNIEGFWIHIDADVLHDDLMPAVDYRNPDGLTWAQLTTIVQTALATGRARGIDLAIFNPTLDPDGSMAQRLVRFLAECLT